MIQPLTKLLVAGSAAVAGVAAFCVARRQSEQTDEIMAESDYMSGFATPPAAGTERRAGDVEVPTYRPPRWDAPLASHIDLVRQRHERDLLGTDGVLGVGSGRSSLGDDAILVYVRDDHVAHQLPRALEGVPVEPVVTGPIRSL